jgi:hypothetical protein
MRRMLLLLAVAALMGAAMMAGAVPAFAQEKPTFIPNGCFLVPPGNPEAVFRSGTLLTTPGNQQSCIPALLPSNV